MKHIIVNAYQWILYIGMAFWIICSTWGGYTLGGYFGEDEALGGGVLGFLVGVLGSVFFLGLVFVILQIRDLLQDLINIQLDRYGYGRHDDLDLQTRLTRLKEIREKKDKVTSSTARDAVTGINKNIKCPHCNEITNVDNYSAKAFLRCKHCKEIIQKGL